MLISQLYSKDKQGRIPAITLEEYVGWILSSEYEYDCYPTDTHGHYSENEILSEQLKKIKLSHTHLTQPFKEGMLIGDNPMFDGWTQDLDQATNGKVWVIFRNGSIEIQNESQPLYNCPNPTVNDFIRTFSRLGIQLYFNDIER